MKYRREIDGLRAVAVLPVLLFHAGFSWFSGGFVGVDVFFVISGYLITSIIHTELEKGSFSLVSFYERRARRILPALFFVLCASAFAGWFLLLPGDLLDLSHGLAAIPLFCANFLFWGESGYFDTAAELKPLLHTWSLAVEEQFYMIYPLLMLLVSRVSLRSLPFVLASLAIFSFAAAEYLSIASPATAFYLLPSRAWELLVGALVALHLANNKRFIIPAYLNQVLSAMGLGAILFAVVTFTKATPFPGVYALLPVVGAALIIVCAGPQTWVGRLLGMRPIVGLGLISYSTYLWHQPLFAFARNVLVYAPSVHLLLGLCLLSIAMGFISWRFIEAPFRRQGQSTAFSAESGVINGFQILISSFILSFSLIAFGLGGHLTNGYDGRADEKVRRIERERLEKRRVREAFGGCRTPALTEGNACILGEGKVLGAIIGDSHARELTVPFTKLFLNGNFSVLSSAINGCPPIENVYRADLGVDHRCSEANQQLFQYLLTAPDLKFVVLTARWTIYYKRERFNNLEGGSEAGTDVILELTDTDGKRLRHSEEVRQQRILEQYRSSINKLLERGLKVFLVYPTPEVGLDVPKSMAKARFIHNEDLSIATSYRLFKERNKEITELFDGLAENPNLVRIRPDEFICNSQEPDRCSTVLGDQVLYADDDHLSFFGASLVAKEIGKFSPWQ